MENQMRKRKILLSLISVAMSLTALFGVIAPTVLAGTETPDYDFSREGSQHTKILNSADILEAVLGTRLGEAERAYLVEYGETEIKYEDGITSSNIRVDYDGSSLTLYAYEYKYTADNGVEIVWTPASATLFGAEQSLSLSEGAYVSTFDSVSNADETTTVDVRYTLGISVLPETLESLVNRAYDDSLAWEEYVEERDAEYASALEEYRVAKEQYDGYLALLAQYELDERAYNDYLAAKRLYDLALNRYNKYLADLVTYEAEKKARDEYLVLEAQYKLDAAEYTKYENAYASYEIEAAIYAEYLSKLDKFNAHLAIMEYARTPVTDMKRSAYTDIMGGTVDKVLAERELLKELHAPERVIDLAGASTRNLRTILSEYYAIESDVARYDYYSKNFTAIRDNFVNLFTALDCLYTSNGVQAAIATAETLYPDSNYDTKFRILIANLYIISHALSDTPVKSVSTSLIGSKDTVAPRYKKGYTYSTFTIDELHPKTLTQIIGNVDYVKDTNSAQPLTTGHPGFMAEPTPPNFVARPIPPAYVAEPAVPTPVSNPGDAPDEVTKPTAPETVDEPTVPEPYAPPAVISQLIAARDNTLVRRDLEFNTPAVIAVEKTVNKRFVNVSEIVVAFHSESGELLEHHTVDAGSAVNFEGRVPEKLEDARAVYTFAGWQTEDGTRVDLSAVENNVDLYPYFHEDYKYYRISWVVDGTTTTEVLRYGTVPSYGAGTPTKPSTPLHMYTFIGWDKEIVSVTGDAVYTALFEEEDVIPSDGDVTVTFDGNDYLVDATTGRNTRSFDISGILERSEGLTGVKIVTRSATLEISPESVMRLKERAASEIRISVVTNVQGYFRYSVEALSPETRSLPENIPVELTVPMTRELNSRVRLRALAPDGSITYTRYTVADEHISFTANVGYNYELCEEYALSAFSSDSLTFTLSHDVALVGDVIRVDVSLAPGTILKSLYYVDGDGNVGEIRASRVFVMPKSDVTVMAVTEQIRYTVTFMNGDAVFTTVSAVWGSIPLPPDTPKKASDGEYTYTFTGWDREISPVTGDAVYTAVFEATPIPVVDEPEDTSPSIYDTLKGIAIGIGVVLFILVAWVGTSCILSARRYRY